MWTNHWCASCVCVFISFVLIIILSHTAVELRASYNMTKTSNGNICQTVTCWKVCHALKASNIATFSIPQHTWQYALMRWCATMPRRKRHLLFISTTQIAIQWHFLSVGIIIVSKEHFFWYTTNLHDRFPCPFQFLSALFSYAQTRSFNHVDMTLTSCECPIRCFAWYDCAGHSGLL